MIVCKMTSHLIFIYDDTHYLIVIHNDIQDDISPYIQYDGTQDGTLL